MFWTDGLAEIQKQSLEQMGLGTKGPADTIGDGECQFRSFSQSEAVVRKGTVWSMTHSEEAQSGYVSARRTSAAAIRASDALQKGIVDRAEQLTSDSRHQGCNYQHALQGQDVSSLPSLVADKVMKPISLGGFWGDEWSAKGLAVGAQVDIIVIAQNQVQLYSKDPYYAPPQARKYYDRRTLPAYFIFAAKYGRQKYDLPAEAFMPATRFLLHDGESHYYAAYRKSDLDGSAAPSVSSAEAAGLKVLHPCSLPALATASTASRVPRSPTTRAAAKMQALLQLNRGDRLPAADCPAASATLSAVDMEEEAAQGLVQMGQSSTALLPRRSSRKKRKRLIASL